MRPEYRAPFRAGDYDVNDADWRPLPKVPPISGNLLFRQSDAESVLISFALLQCIDLLASKLPKFADVVAEFNPPD